MARRPGLNSHTHAAKVASAMLALANGTAETKKDAAQIAGTSTSALKPQQLAAITANNPLFRQLFRASALDITVEISEDKDGQQVKRRVSMREALSRGAEECVRTMWELSAKVGKWTREESESFRQAERFLRVCRDAGLFRDGEGPALPGELAQQPEELEEGSVDWYLQDMRGHGLPGLLTVIPSTEEIPVDAESVAPADSVG